MANKTYSSSIDKLISTTTVADLIKAKDLQKDKGIPRQMVAFTDEMTISEALKTLAKRRITSAPVIIGKKLGKQVEGRETRGGNVKVLRSLRVFLAYSTVIFVKWLPDRTYTL